MATTRINAVSATATTFAGDDFLPIDGNVNATRRLLLTSLFASPSAIGSVTPAAGTFTSLSGTNINGTLGATTPSTISGTTGTFSGNIGITNATRPALTLTQTGTTALGRVYGINSGFLTISQNLFYDGSSYQLDDVSNGGTTITIGNGTLDVGIAGASANPASVTTRFSLTSTGLNSTAIGATTASTGAFTTVSATGQITSTVASGTVTLESTAPYGTGYKAIRLGNTGSTLTVGIESSAGGSLLTSATGYAGVVSSNSTILQLGASNTIVATLSSGAAAITGTLSATGQISTSATGNALNISTAGATALYQNIGNSAGNIELGAITTGEAYVASGGNKDLRFYRYGSLMASITSTGLAVTGTFTSTVADAGIGARFAGATGKFYLQPYYDATEGARMFSLNAAESGYLPLSFIGSTVRIAPSASLVGLFSSTGLAITGTLSSTGNLSTTGDLRVTDTGSSHFILIGNQDSGGANKPNIIRGVNGTLSLGYGTSWSSSGGGTMTSIADISSTGLAVTGTLSATGDVTFGTTRLITDASRTTIMGALELNYSGGVATVQGYDRTGAAYKTLNLSGSAVAMIVTGAGTATFTGAGMYTAVGTANGLIGLGGITASYPAIRYNSATEVGFVIADQSAYCATRATAFNVSSDRRIKTNIRNYNESGAMIDAIVPRIYDMDTSRKMHENGKTNQIGFIAQELYPVFEQAVTKGDDNEEITEEWGIDYSKLVPVLVAELQSLRKRLAALESK